MTSGVTDGVDNQLGHDEQVTTLTPKQIVEEVFMLTRQRIDESDPIVALLVFVIGIIILCEISRVLSSIPLIFETIEK